MKNILKIYKIQCDTSLNGVECIERIKEKLDKNCDCNKNQYKIIFMDYMMPQMNGLEASKMIQTMNNDGLINPNIVFITAHDKDDMQNNLKELSVVKSVLQKPVKKLLIEEMLNNYYY